MLFFPIIPCNAIVISRGLKRTGRFCDMNTDQIYFVQSPVSRYLYLKHYFKISTSSSIWQTAWKPVFQRLSFNTFHIFSTIFSWNMSFFFLKCFCSALCGIFLSFRERNHSFIPFWKVGLNRWRLKKMMTNDFIFVALTFQWISRRIYSEWKEDSILS